MKVTPEMIAPAWAVWKPRHRERMGPGPGFVEAIQAAIDAMPVATEINDDMRLGWNMCRRQVYLLSEHEQDTGPYADDMSDYARGYRYMAKSFGRAFRAFGPDDCDFLIEAVKDRREQAT